MWPYLLAGGATLLSMNANRKAAGAEIDAGSADLSSALLSGHFREKGIREKRDRVLGAMRARAAASGVEMAGSPLEVLLSSAAQAERDLVISRHITERNADAARARISSGVAAKKQAGAAGLLRLGALGFAAGKDFKAGYQPPGGPDDWIKEYGWD